MLDQLEKIMKTELSKEVALLCTSGIVQYSDSIDSMLDQYNRNGKWYEIRTDEDGNKIMWHKGHRRNCGVFQDSNRDK